MPQASQETSNSLEKSGSHKIGASVILYLISLKSFAASTGQ